MFLPAVCDNCGVIFSQRLFRTENVRNLSISNVSISPCPNCGGTGHIPDGVYNVTANVIEVLAAPQRSMEELRRFAEILEQARARKESPEAVKERIRKESPELATLADLIPATRSEFYAFLAVAIAAASLIVQLSRPSEKATNVTIEQVINNITVIEAPKDPSPKKAQPTKKAEPEKAERRGSNYRKEKRRLKKSERRRGRR